MTPAICVATLALARCPVVATWHAAGELGWMRFGLPVWGFLIDRIDHRIAVSRMAAESAEQWLGPGYDIVPNGVVIPQHAEAGNREHRIVFIGRHDTRKGLPVLLRAWPEIRRRTGARLRLIGTDPLQYRLLHARLRFDDDGIDVLGIVTNEVRDAELATAKAFVSPALGAESFGLVLVEAFAAATPVVASDIPGFADVSTRDAAVLVPPGDESALAEAVTALLADEERRVAMGRAARTLAVERYSWADVARRLEGIYEQATATA
jgi:phosphatidylinositol alpha-mannosyltransferase